MNKGKLNICSVNDPMDPVTWSGTPYNLVCALQKRDQLGTAFEVKVSLLSKEIARLKSFQNFQYVELYRSIHMRNLRAQSAANVTEKSDTNHTLHLSSLTLPFIKKPTHQKHYLFCDYTWDLWSSQATTMSKYTNAQIEAFDEIEKVSFI